MIIRAASKPSQTPEALVVPLRQDDFLEQNLRDLGAAMGHDAALLLADFKAEAKEVFSFYSSAPQAPARVFLVGLGKSPKLADALAAGRSFCHKTKSKLPARVAVELRQLVDNEQVTATAEGFSNGLALGLYSISLYKTEEKKELSFGSKESIVEFLVNEKWVAEAEKAAVRGQLFAVTQKRIFDLLNAPGNKKTPRVLAEWALASARDNGFETTVFYREEIEKKGLQALLSVSEGSPNTPAFIILEYNGGKNAPKIGLVGKGVTFDTGGISVKPSENMHLMKSDMGGAAAVFGAVEMAARLKLPVHLIGIVPSTENMVDGRATKPGDVIGSFAGKTIEVIDTDAEGRLVLADGLAYMAKIFQPAAMIDLATLTGSVVRMFGNQCAGLFTQNDALAGQLLAAGEASGERLWRLPMWDAFGEAMKSDVADVRNLSARPVSDAINASKFLEHFTEKHQAWAHLDIAGMAMTAGEFATDRAATGFGVRLLVEFVEAFLEEKAA